MMCFVKDVVILFSIIIVVDLNDVVMYDNEWKVYMDYMFFLDVNGLWGVRIGVLCFYY